MYVYLLVVVVGMRPSNPLLSGETLTLLLTTRNYSCHHPASTIETQGNASRIAVEGAVE